MVTLSDRKGVVSLKRGKIKGWMLVVCGIVCSYILMTGGASAAQLREIEVWVPTVTGWERSEETGELEPRGTPEQFDLTSYTRLSGKLNWQLSDSNSTGAVLDEQGILTLVPSCSAGTIHVTVTNRTDSEMIRIRVEKSEPYCWGGLIHSPGSKVKVPAAGEASLKQQYGLSVYDQYGELVNPEAYQATWYILPWDDWSVEYTELDGISISQTGLLTIAAGAKARDLTIRVRLDCWESQTCQNGLRVSADPTVRWRSPGVVEWDAVEGTERYVVVLQDENGERVGSNKTSSTSAELFSFMGWYMGNESQTYCVVVEARDENNKKIAVMDPGLTVNAEVLEESLSYSCMLNSGNRYTLTVMHPIAAGDVLLDTWRTSEGGKDCHRTEFSHAEALYTSSEHQVKGETQEIRLLSDSRLEGGKVWHFTLTAADPQSLDDLLDAPTDWKQTMEAASGSRVSGTCILSAREERGEDRWFAYVILKNAAGYPVETNIFLVGYDKNGKLIHCDMEQVVIGGSDTAITLHINGDADVLSVFVLDPDLNILTQKAETETEQIR